MRSQKQQTTPRTEYSAIQIAPPVRAGPIDRTENPSPVLTTESSISEKAPRVITPEPVLQPEARPEVQPVVQPPSEPIEKPIKLRGSKIEREPPVIIKPAYSAQPVGVTESQLDSRIGSLKGWIESELMGKLLESRQQQPREEQPNRLRDEAALRLLIEQRLRDVLNARERPVQKQEPALIQKPIVVEKPVAEPASATSTPSSVYKPLR